MELNYILNNFTILRSNTLYYISYSIIIKCTYFEDGYTYNEDDHIQDYIYNSDIARAFHMTQGEFIDLALKHNAKKCKLNKMLFNTEEDAINFAEYLQSLNVMNNLE